MQTAGEDEREYNTEGWWGASADELDFASVDRNFVPDTAQACCDSAENSFFFSKGGWRI